MNLYKIWTTHYAPKDSCSATKYYLLAESDDQVCDYILEFDWLYGSCYTDTSDVEVEYEKFQESYTGELDDENGYELWRFFKKSDWFFEARKKYLEKMKSLYLEHKGDDDEEVAPYSDLYYGQTRTSWTLHTENVDIEKLQYAIQLGIVKRLTDKP